LRPVTVRHAFSAFLALGRYCFRGALVPDVRGDTDPVEDGAALYANRCSGCHGNELRAYSDGPAFGLRRLRPDEQIDLLFEKVPGGRGGYNRWTINGKSWRATNPLFTTEVGKRYHLPMTNKSGDNHPVHLHRHSFEVSKAGDKATASVVKDTINMTRFSDWRLISSPTIRGRRCCTAIIRITMTRAL